PAGPRARPLPLRCSRIRTGFSRRWCAAAPSPALPRPWPSADVSRNDFTWASLVALAPRFEARLGRDLSRLPNEAADCGMVVAILERNPAERAGACAHRGERLAALRVDARELVPSHGGNVANLHPRRWDAPRSCPRA